MKIYLLFIFFSIHLFSKTSLPNNSKFPQTITLLSQNVGGADFKFIFFLKPAPVCPFFKLCHQTIMNRVYDNIRKTLPDIIHFQEIANSNQLKDLSSPLIPSNYDFNCTFGAKKTQEICTAWNKEKINLISDCVHFNTEDSGLMKCFFRKDNFTFSTINVHPSAWDSKDRKKTINALWKSYVQLNENILIAGDFNTETETFSGDFPYPPEFGTVFGISRMNYGRWPGKKDFYGFFNSTSNYNKVIEVTGSTIFFEKIDHAFANFGSIKSETKSSNVCKYAICPGNHFGYHWGPADWSFFYSWGPKIDHLPIWMELAL